MKFLHREVHSFEDASRNFEQIESQSIYSGSGAPTFVPVENQVGKAAVYFRLDLPTAATALHAVYQWQGSSWVGIV